MNRRVLLASNAQFDPNAGVAGTVLELGKALETHGWEPTYSFAPGTRRLAIERQLTYLRVVAAVARTRPALAVVSSGDGALLPLLAPAVPLVVHSHGLEHMARAASIAHGLPHSFGFGHVYLREPAVSFASKHAEALVVQTNDQRVFAIEEYGCRADRVHVIPNAVDDMFFRETAREQTDPTIVWLGSWIPRKGIAILPDVLRETLESQPSARLHLLGTGAPEGTVRGGFPDNLQGAISVTPHATRNEIFAALAAARVGLFTSVFEGFGRALVEMAAVGLPIVSTRAGAAEDLLGAGSGDLVSHDPAHVAAALSPYLADAQRAERRGSVLRHSARRYQWDVVGQEWEYLLSTTARSGR